MGAEAGDRLVVGGTALLGDRRKAAVSHPDGTPLLMTGWLESEPAVAPDQAAPAPSTHPVGSPS